MLHSYIDVITNQYTIDDYTQNVLLDFLQKLEIQVPKKHFILIQLHTFL